MLGCSCLSSLYENAGSHPGQLPGGAVHRDYAPYDDEDRRKAGPAQRAAPSSPARARAPGGQPDGPGHRLHRRGSARCRCCGLSSAWTKREIIRIARKIDTFETPSCPMRTAAPSSPPRHPRTRPKLAMVGGRREAAFDFAPCWRKRWKGPSAFGLIPNRGERFRKGNPYPKEDSPMIAEILSLSAPCLGSQEAPWPASWKGELALFGVQLNHLTECGQNQGSTSKCPDRSHGAQRHDPRCGGLTPNPPSNPPCAKGWICPPFFTCLL